MFLCALWYSSSVWVSWICASPLPWLLLSFFSGCTSASMTKPWFHPPPAIVSVVLFVEYFVWTHISPLLRRCWAPWHYVCWDFRCIVLPMYVQYHFVPTYTVFFFFKGCHNWECHAFIVPQALLIQICKRCIITFTNTVLKAKLGSAQFSSDVLWDIGKHEM
jgi:hypothetical protein